MTTCAREFRGNNTRMETTKTGWQRYDGGWETLDANGMIVRVEREGGEWIAYGDGWQEGPFETSADARESCEVGQ